MSEIYCIMTLEGCYEPFTSTPYEQIIPEHRTPREWIPEKPKAQVAPTPEPDAATLEENRKAVIRNLLRMGHPPEEIERVYGKF